MSDLASDSFIPILLAGGGAPLPAYPPAPPLALTTLRRPDGEPAWFDDLRAPRANVLPRACRHCARVFRPKKNSQEICSPSCSAAHARKAGT